MEALDVQVVVGGVGAVKRPRVVTFKIDPDVLAVVDEAARKLGLSRSELIRMALESYISLFKERGGAGPCKTLKAPVSLD